MDLGVLHDAQRDLVLLLVEGHAVGVLLDDEALDLVVVLVAGPDHDQVGEGGVADPLLLAVEHPARRRRAGRWWRGRRRSPEPTSGSVSPNAPISSIRAIAGSQRSRCSSEPHRSIEPIASPPWTPMKVPIDGSTRASSIATMPSTQGAASRAARSVVRQAGDAELGDARDQLVRELRAGPVVVDHRLDLAGHERAHVAEQLAVLVLEQQLEAQEVRERGVLRVEVGHGLGHGWCSSSVRKSSITGASSPASVRMPRWPPR